MTYCSVCQRSPYQFTMCYQSALYESLLDNLPVAAHTIHVTFFLKKHAVQRQNRNPTLHWPQGALRLWCFELLLSLWSGKDSRWSTSKEEVSSDDMRRSIKILYHRRGVLCGSSVAIKYTRSNPPSIDFCSCSANFLCERS